jgi:uncharacterized membrane protein YfcA
LDNVYLILAGFFIGTFGTLIGAGGGFILVPLLILFYPGLPPETVTAISMAVVAMNAISGSAAYARSGRIDYKAGIVFALFTIPGSVLGVFTVQYIPQRFFNCIFGVLLILLSVFLFYRKKEENVSAIDSGYGKNDLKHAHLIDNKGASYHYSYSQQKGAVISILVGYLSPLLGIGGGIIHVPAMVNWLHFPVHIATATSHFILAVMSTVSVIVHYANGSYNNPEIVKMVLLLAIGVIPGAQTGAYFSHKIKGSVIIRVLAACLIVVGVRILTKSF